MSSWPPDLFFVFEIFLDVTAAFIYANGNPPIMMLIGRDAKRPLRPRRLAFFQPIMLLDVRCIRLYFNVSYSVVPNIAEPRHHELPEVTASIMVERLP